MIFEMAKDKKKEKSSLKINDAPTLSWWELGSENVYLRGCVKLVPVALIFVLKPSKGQLLTELDP